MDGPRKGYLAARKCFLKRMQGEEENFDEFADVLTELSLPCDYGSMRGMMVRDVFVINLHPKHADIQEKLMSAGDLTLSEAVMLSKVTTFTINEIDPLYECKPKSLSQNSDGETPDSRHRRPNQVQAPILTSVQQRLMKYRRGSPTSKQPSPRAFSSDES